MNTMNSTITSQDGQNSLSTEDKTTVQILESKLRASIERLYNAVDALRTDQITTFILLRNKKPSDEEITELCRTFAETRGIVHRKYSDLIPVN